MRHTPGPWERVGFGIWSYKEGQYRRVAFAAVDNGRGDGVARIETEEEAVANARLIASSPDLLAALEELVSHLRPLAGDDSPYMDILMDAEAAIRAATGEGDTDAQPT